MTKNQTATQRLIAAAALLTAAQEPFKVGDVIIWKSVEMRNRKWPDIAEPTVVTAVLAEPLKNDPDEFGSPLCNELLDIKIGCFCRRDGELNEYLVDRRRFRIATQAEIDAWDAKN